MRWTYAHHAELKRRASAAELVLKTGYYSSNSFQHLFGHKQLRSVQKLRAEMEAVVSEDGVLAVSRKRLGSTDAGRREMAPFCRGFESEFNYLMRSLIFVTI